MRSVVMNRIDIIIQPAISGFNFPCFNMPQFDAKDIVAKQGQDKDIDRFRYRRK